MVSFLGYQISNRGVKDDVTVALAMVESGRKGGFVSTINPHSAVVASKDTVFRNAMRSADLLIPDGIGIVLAGRFLGLSVAERVTGFDFFWRFSKRAQEKEGISYFFLGSTQDVLDAVVKRLAQEFPGIRVAGTLSPPFKPEFSEEDNLAMCEKINASGADVLWVGLTAPKQEKWIFSNRHRLNVGCAAAIGAVFDFYAGTKARAPEWMQRLGCEWLHRLVSEPKRMWRRYLINNPRFLMMVLREKLRLAQSGKAAI